MPTYIKDINKDSLDKIFTFIYAINHLQSIQITKHTGYSNSLVEHCWQTSMMVMAITPHLDIRIDLKKALKLSLLQGIFQWLNMEQVSVENEVTKRAINSACLNLDGIFGLHLYELNEEYHQQVTYESKVVKAISQICQLIPTIKSQKSTAILPLSSEQIHLSSFDSGIATWGHYVAKMSSLIASEMASELSCEV